MKRKDFKIDLYGQTFSVDNIPSIIHNDLRHIIQGCLRKKPKFSLNSERNTALEQLVSQNSFSYHGKPLTLKSLDDLKFFLINRRKEFRSNFDAEEYYNIEKSKKYTEGNVVSQEILSNRVFDLLQVNVCNWSLYLDICCGSGLSTKRHFTIGVDASPQMLNIARRTIPQADFVLWDLKQPLPYRDKVFDFATSVSAIHFLCGPTDEETRCQRFFSSLKQVCKSDFSFQFFPEEKHVPKLLLKSSRLFFHESSALLLDFSYHTRAFRWFLSSSKRKKQHASTCLLYNSISKLSWFEMVPVKCVLSLTATGPSCSKEHINWVRSQHASMSRTLIRKFKYDPNLLTPLELDLVENLLKAFSDEVTLKQLKDRYLELDSILHCSHKI